MVRMKINFLSPTPNLSGGIRVIAIYAAWLKRNGHDVKIYSPVGKRLPLRKRIKQFITGQGWPVDYDTIASHFDDIDVEHVVFDKHTFFTNENIRPADVLVATWWETAEWATKLDSERGARVYFVQHHEIFDYLPVDRCKATYLLPFHKIVVAQWLADVMAEEYSDAHCDLVPNAVNRTLFYAGLRFKQSRPTVGFLCNTTPLKGLSVALDIVKSLKEIIPNLRVISFASTEPSGQLKIDSSIEVTINPQQNSLRDLYAQCDVWLSTSRTEGFNLMAMEAMACGTPVVSTKTGWPAEAIQDGINGYLIDIDNVEQGSAAAAKILAMTDAEWLAMSGNALKTVEHSSWDNSSRLFEQALFRARLRATRGEIFGPCTPITTP